MHKLTNNINLLVQNSYVCIYLQLSSELSIKYCTYSPEIYLLIIILSIYFSEIYLCFYIETEFTILNAVLCSIPLHKNNSLKMHSTFKWYLGYS